jgi:hypothetical protein
MTVGGLVYLPQKLGLSTKEKGGSYWLTPTTSTDANYDAYLKRMARKKDPKSRGKKKATNLAMQLGGMPNPEWTEWLMGYPSSWTVIDPSVMPWYLSKQDKRLSA